MKLLLISVKSDKRAGGIAVWTDHYLANCANYNIDYRLVNTEVSPRRTKSKVSRVLNECTRTFRIFRNLSQTLKTSSFDIAHINTSCGPMGLYRDYLIAKQLQKHDIPFVVHYHCDISFWIHTKQRRRCLNKLANMATANFVLCENSRMYLKQFGINALKVPNFIENYVVTDKPKEIRDTVSRIFFVGRISIPKGANEIYELARRFPDKLFVLTGSLIPPVDAWEKPSNVQLMGRLTFENIMRLLDQADLFLFPSHSEGFSLALMEAMARGVPCLAFDSVGANGDMLSDDCGVTVPFGDVDAMEQAIRDLEDPAVRKTISENAIRKVRNHYTIDAVMTLFKTLYEKIL